MTTVSSSTPGMLTTVCVTSSRPSPSPRCREGTLWSLSRFTTWSLLGSLGGMKSSLSEKKMTSTNWFWRFGRKIYLSKWISHTRELVVGVKFSRWRAAIHWACSVGSLGKLKCVTFPWKMAENVKEHNEPFRLEHSYLAFTAFLQSRNRYRAIRHWTLVVDHVKTSILFSISWNCRVRVKQTMFKLARSGSKQKMADVMSVIKQGVT